MLSEECIQRLNFCDGSFEHFARDVRSAHFLEKCDAPWGDDETHLWGVPLRIQYILEHCVHRAGAIELRDCAEDREAARVIAREESGHDTSRPCTKIYN
jgi:hypothetical protein